MCFCQNFDRSNLLFFRLQRTCRACLFYFEKIYGTIWQYNILQDVHQFGLRRQFPYSLNNLLTIIVLSLFQLDKPVRIHSRGIWMFCKVMFFWLLFIIPTDTIVSCWNLSIGSFFVDDDFSIATASEIWIVLKDNYNNAFPVLKLGLLRMVPVFTSFKLRVCLSANFIISLHYTYNPLQFRLFNEFNFWRLNVNAPCASFECLLVLGWVVIEMHYLQFTSYL